MGSQDHHAARPVSVLPIIRPFLNSRLTLASRYIISTAISAVIGPVGIFGLRTLNAAILPLMIPLVVDIDAGTWNAKLGLARSRRLTKTTLQPSFSPLSLHALHSAFNICLFPPLFFFSALYYTDIASTVSVVLCYRHFVEVYRNNSPTLLQEVVTVLLGVVSLSFRQTNIFWVSVFPAGLLVVSKVDLGLKQNDVRLSISSSQSWSLIPAHASD